MEHCMPIRRPSFINHFPSLEDPSTFSRPRHPLSDSAGNAQLHTLASVGPYHDNKERSNRADTHMYTIPTVPSQPSRTLEYRRQKNRVRRHQRISRNPIVDSPQYQAYRQRQNRDGTADDAKWPSVLEYAFLDALIDIPAMGRRKYSFKGKPHGRNELIKEYLWLAYLQSLPPGSKPDMTMQRTRKQVSSHIQVLKGFLCEHPAFLRLFPENRGPRNGFEDSFKNDPCLKALSEGRLPPRRYDQYDDINQMMMAERLPMRPTLFWLLITHETKDRFNNEDDLFNAGMVVHKFTGLSAQRNRGGLDTIPNWHLRFPSLEGLQHAGDLNCDIIHMEASLNLMSSYPPEKAELCSRVEVSIPGRQPDDCQWRIFTSLMKPPELCRDPISDPPLDGKEFLVDIISATDTETKFKLPFPADPWAHAFISLINVQAEFEKKRQARSFGGDSSGLARSARECVEQLSMYQEVRSYSGPTDPYVRRAIILWTFHKTRNGEGNITNWRYIDVSPPRRTINSPSPLASHHVSAAMSETFNTWAEAPMHVQQPNLLDPFAQELATPPQTGGLHSPFGGQNFSYSNLAFDMPSENINYVSNKPIESEATLIENNTGDANIDNFLSNNAVSLGDYDQNGNSWHLPSTESFDADPAWANYGVPSRAPPHLGDWEADAKAHSWAEIPGVRPVSWVDEATAKHDWAEGTVSPTKHANYIEHGIAQKLLPWADHQDASNNGIKNEFVVTAATSIPDLPGGTLPPKSDWHGQDVGFDFSRNG